MPRSKVAKWPDSGATSSTRGCVGSHAVLAEMQQIAERVRDARPPRTATRAAAISIDVNAEVGPLVPHAGARHHLAGGGGAAHQRMMRDQRPGCWLSMPCAARAIHRIGAQRVGVRLIGFIKHRIRILDWRLRRWTSGEVGRLGVEGGLVSRAAPHAGDLM